MASRRQEKVARIIKEAVSDAITNHLNDPRIEGLVSVTRVDLAPDLRSAHVYLSILAGHPRVEDRTFQAIDHARGRVQSFVGKRVTGKFCPSITFARDGEFKKTLETMNLIDQVAAELHAKDEENEKIENPEEFSA